MLKIISLPLPDPLYRKIVQFSKETGRSVESIINQMVHEGVLKIQNAKCVIVQGVLYDEKMY